MAFEKVSSYLNICTSCLLALTATFVVVFGQNEAPINLAVPTECSNYVIAFAGMYSREFYTCCPKPPTTGTESPCKQDPAILNFQCKEPETKFSETKNVSKTFNCNGQIGQKNALNRCTSRWGWLEQDEKEADCWAFPTCFAGACESEVEQTGSSLKGDFCGDGKCDVIEDSDSCPIDCCPYDNPDRCQVVNNTCTDECCGQKLCCRKPRTGGSVGGAITSILIWIIVGVAIFVVVVNLCCCFCCVCCAKRCCKKHKKDKKRKGNDKNTPV